MSSSVVSFFILLCCLHQALCAVSDEQGGFLGVAVVVLVAYIIIDVVLILAIIWWCKRTTSSSKSKESPVRLKLRRKLSEVSNSEYEPEKISQGIVSETIFEEEKEESDGIQLSEVVYLEVLDDPSDKENVFQKEQHLVTPERKKRLSFEERKKEARMNRYHSGSIRKNSETPLLLTGDNKSDEDEGSPLSMDSSSDLEPCSDKSSPQRVESPSSTDPHLVSITSKLTGPIIPQDNGIHPVPREIQSLDFNAIAEARKDSTACNETSFNGDLNFISHEKSGSELETNSTTGPGTNDMSYLTPTDDYNLHTLSGSSLGYSEVERTVQSIRQDVNTIIKHSNENLQWNPAYSSNTRSHTDTGDESTNENLQWNPAYSSITRSHTDTGDKSTNTDFFQLSVPLPPSFFTPDASIHQRSFSVSQTHSHVMYSDQNQNRSSDPGMLIKRFREQQLAGQKPGSLSASNTPIHQPKF